MTQTEIKFDQISFPPALSESVQPVGRFPLQVLVAIGGDGLKKREIHVVGQFFDNRLVGLVDRKKNLKLVAILER